MIKRILAAVFGALLFGIVVPVAYYLTLRDWLLPMLMNGQVRVG